MVEHSFAGRCGGDVRFKRMTSALSACSRGPNMMSYRHIRREYQSGDLVEPVLVDHYAKLISPIFTNLFFEAGLAPNTVTILMMCAGFVGATLFAMPLLGLKACGVFFIHTWYVLDCNIPSLVEKKEWKDTSVIWEILARTNATQIDMTHVGIVPEIECFDACRRGWNHFIKVSLTKFLNEGEGLPEGPGRPRAPR